MTSRWIVVGAGSAGCAVAARLSEDPDRLVTLLEAGPALDAPGTLPTGPPSDSTAIDGANFFDALGARGRTYVDLLASRSAGDVPRPYLRGRGLGGSSAVNAMVALRGDPAIYASWGWDDVDAAWRRVAVPCETADETELGPVDRALLASSNADLVPLTRRDGRRVSSAEAYLWPVVDRANLAIRVECVVDSVVIDRRRAVAVQLVDGSALDADHVVLAAGAIHTPAILLRSDVDTQGVGEGLQDHPSVPFTLVMHRPVTDPSVSLVTATILQQDGFQLLPMNHLGGGADTAGLGVLMAAVMRPHGRSGIVKLRSPDPLDHPDVHFNLLHDRRDVDQMMEAAGLARSVLAQPAFRDAVDAIQIDDHGTSVDALDDADAMRSWVSAVGGDYVHASSTCAMGRVVDGDGAVIGYERLSVCDASVFPSIPDVNTHLPTTMLAERLVARWMSDG
jgi:choline dehydrogenase-like flavoprotein